MNQLDTPVSVQPHVCISVRRTPVPVGQDLRNLQSSQASAIEALQSLQPMCCEVRPPLRLDRNVCGPTQLQTFSLLSITAVCYVGARPLNPRSGSTFQRESGLRGLSNVARNSSAHCQCGIRPVPSRFTRLGDRSDCDRSVGLPCLAHFIEHHY